LGGRGEKEIPSPCVVFRPQWQKRKRERKRILVSTSTTRSSALDKKKKRINLDTLRDQSRLHHGTQGRGKKTDARPTPTAQYEEKKGKRMQTQLRPLADERLYYDVSIKEERSAHS